jgi:hypothetical protein
MPERMTFLRYLQLMIVDQGGEAEHQICCGEFIRQNGTTFDSGLVELISREDPEDRT